MTLRHLRVFVAVADQESVTKAAKELYIAQPTVSVAIRELEEHYGICLFERLNKRLRITEEGKRLLGYARHIIGLSEEMERAVGDPDQRGLLRLGCSVTAGAYYAPKAVKKLKESWPQLEVRVRVHASDEIERQILKDELDLAVIEGVLHSEYLVCEPLMDDRMIPVASPSAYPEEMDLPRLLGCPLLLRERGSGAREILEHALGVRGYKAEAAWESSSVEALKMAAGEGVGIAFLPERLVEDEIRRGTLFEIRIPDFVIRRTIRMIYHRSKYISAGMEGWMSLIRQIFDSQKHYTSLPEFHDGKETDFT